METDSDPVTRILSQSSVECVLKLKNVRLHIDNRCIGWAVFDVPQKSANVIDSEVIADANQTLDEIERQISMKRIRVLVIISAKKDSFGLGADVKSLYPITDEKLAAEAAAMGQRLFDRLEKLRIPTIAAINGPALGAFCELALACTFRLAASGKRVSIGLPEVKLGILPGAGGTVRLPRIVGLQAALQIILPGGSVSADKAKRIGLVDKVLESEDRFANENRFFHSVRAFAANLVDRPPNKPLRLPRHRPLSQRLMEGTWLGRRIVRRTAEKTLDKQTRGRYPAPYAALDSVINSVRMQHRTARALEFEASMFGKLAATAECKNLMSIFLLTDEAKKRPSIPRRLPLNQLKVAVIGAGVMGSGIAQLLIYNNIHVYMRDIKDEFVANGVRKVRELFDEIVKRRSLTKEAAASRLALLSSGTSMDGVRDADLVIEAAVESMDLKQKILASCEAVGPSHMIFATNTSALSITELASVSVRPQNVVGMHFFNPVHRMPLIEIVRGSKTSDEAVAAVQHLTLDMGKIPVTVRDGPGFLVNRVLALYMREAGQILLDGGADIATIDKSLFDFGMPMGPFRLLDEVGLDVGAHVASILEKGLGERFRQPAFLTAAKGRLGKKTNRGVYLYKDGRSVGVDPDLVRSIRQVAKRGPRLSKADIVDRCILPMVNEAAMVLEEGRVAKAEDVDLGMVMGTGFAPFRGGLFAYADSRGIKSVVDRLNSLKESLGSRFKPCELLLRMATSSDFANSRFFPHRPFVPFVERRNPRALTPAKL